MKHPHILLRPLSVILLWFLLASHAFAVDNLFDDLGLGGQALSVSGQDGYHAVKR